MSVENVIDRYRKEVNRLRRQKGTGRYAGRDEYMWNTIASAYEFVLDDLLED